MKKLIVATLYMLGFLHAPSNYGMYGSNGFCTLKELVHNRSRVPSYSTMNNQENYFPKKEALKPKKSTKNIQIKKDKR